MRSLIRYLTRIALRDHLPRLRASLVTRQPLELESWEIQRVIRSGVVRDAHAARELMREYNVSTADDLYRAMPRRIPRPNIRRRLKNWLAHIEGAYTYDPIRNELKQRGRDKIW